MECVNTTEIQMGRVAVPNKKLERRTREHRPQQADRQKEEKNACNTGFREIHEDGGGKDESKESRHRPQENEESRTHPRHPDGRRVYALFWKVKRPVPLR